MPRLLRVLMILVPAMLAAACSEVETTSADQFRKTGELIAMSGGNAGASNACFTCHGLDGRGNGAGAPRLAGLDRGYLDRQLEAYAAGLRRHPEMEWIARRLAAPDRHAVSAYYEAMPYRPSPQVVSGGIGRTLYHEGDPARGLLPCASCHGARGEGLGPANPPLGGQPEAYLAEQLHQWKMSVRRNDPAGIMLAISRRLTPREVEAVAAHAASLPGLPRPGSPEASPGARPAGPRNDASMPLPRAVE